MNILEPLAARYAGWLGLPAEETALPEASPGEVRAMPVILHLEKAVPPGRTALLEAAASAAVAVCLDERAQPGGEWHEPVRDWVSGHIRKVTRRARGTHWQVAQEFPGVTVTVDGAEVRALVPGRVVDVPKEIARLQIQGSDLPPDEPPPAPDDLPLLLLNPEVSMTVGKAAAQVGHGTMILAALLGADELSAWARRGYACAVRTPAVAQWKQLHPGGDPAGAWRSRRVVAVRDAGFTEVEPGTVTVLAQYR
ncbi:peptidyl-tRNA hydrolase [Amycolatopsis alkalitolerans]|uniref:peptidyl-tRNA hydrolase n=1 Tax=Amycolatopsis alkalitolerans TaxID=2547244 RepID=A0A5C4LPB5_9PSEU|nr:peptidyl-tRNA hydrolase [Amycolatopsis alkalitolerans]TNC19226.1 peptidyl-tRNA hydrolase [Amycolatopsis alkalitolerans]